ncbi:class I SAM-dependent methyltransferase [Dongia sp.]|uniref:class I SAM-dependent methyltransferase n=1 Tax=Dongia sp. TaxID=1977262 RepID=UPI0035B1FE89
MSDQTKSAVTAHYDGEVDFYSDRYDKAFLERTGEYPSNYVRLEILSNRLAHFGAKRLFEVGMGEGTPLFTWGSMGIEVSGCDLSQPMVKATRARLDKAGIKAPILFVGDAEDAKSLAPALALGKYDAVIASGVLPHIQKETAFFDNMKMMLRPGGRIFVEFRNKLFSLFTMNRYTKEFVLDDLLAGVSAEVKQHVAAELDKRLATNLPPLRGHDDPDRPSYDQILAKFHNPFELEATVAQHGFRTIGMHWYHYHATPPMLADKVGAAFNTESAKLELEAGWRGMFLCSAGIIEAELA